MAKQTPLRDFESAESSLHPFVWIKITFWFGNFNTQLERAAEFFIAPVSTNAYRTDVGPKKLWKFSAIKLSHWRLDPINIKGRGSGVWNENFGLSPERGLIKKNRRSRLKLIPEAEKVEDDSVDNSVWQGVLLIQQDPAQNHPLQGSRAQYFLPKIRIIESVFRTLESDPLKNC